MHLLIFGSLLPVQTRSDFKTAASSLTVPLITYVVPVDPKKFTIFKLYLSCGKVSKVSMRKVMGNQHLLPKVSYS